MQEYYAPKITLFFCIKIFSYKKDELFFSKLVKISFASYSAEIAWVILSRHNVRMKRIVYSGKNYTFFCVRKLFHQESLSDYVPFCHHVSVKPRVLCGKICILFWIGSYFLYEMKSFTLRVIKYISLIICRELCFLLKWKEIWSYTQTPLGFKPNVINQMRSSCFRNCRLNLEKKSAFQVILVQLDVL